MPALVVEMKYNPRLRNIPVSIIDDDVAKHGKKINGVNIDGGREKLWRLQGKRIDDIIIAIPSASKGYKRNIQLLCKNRLQGKNTPVGIPAYR